VLLEVSAQRLVDFGDASYHVANSPLDVDAGPLRRRAGLSVAPSEPHRSGQLVAEVLALTPVRPCMMRA
jgi:hypothetical protein